MNLSSGQIARPTSVDRLPAAVALLVALLVVVGGCGDEEQPKPPSLETPNAMATAIRDSCGTASPVLEQIGDGRCVLGLIANADTGSLAVADLGRRTPRLFDLDPSVPAFTHLEVGRRPIDVASSPDGSTAYTLDSIGGNLSVIDLWQLETLPETIPVPGHPVGLATAPAEAPGGHLAVATSDPDAIWLRPGVHCQEASSADNCSGLEAEPTQFPLPGRPAALEISADGRIAYVVYDNRDYMSAIALPGRDELLDAEMYTCRGGRTGAPCEARRIGLTYGCSDGVDSDGDGLADQEDPQCWGPNDAETPDGIGRRYTGVCSDGEDNDGDGEVDRNDPDCQIAAGASEADKTNPDAVFACSDGEDNDGDGLADYPEDPDCYGPTGQRESAVETTGFDDIGVGNGGAFLYVVDGSKNQVLTVDARRGTLIDAAKTVPPHGAAFTDQLGIPVGSRPNDAVGFVSRDIAWQDPDDEAHGIVEYTFGTYVSADNGQLYAVRTVTSDCEVTETDRDSLLSNREFELGSEAFQSSNERHCLQTPPFPLPKGDEDGDDAPACQAVEMCRTCLDAEPEGMNSGCEEACSNFEENRRQCRLQGRRLSPTENVDLVVNPHFSLIDAEETTGRLRGTGSCTAPNAFVEQMREYVSDNPDAPEAFSCPSSLRDQPVERFGTDEQLDQPSFDDLERADLLQFTTLQLSPPTEDNADVHEQTVERPFDFRYRDENWTVTWEGVLPGTRREDGLLADDQPGRLLTAPRDLCKAGVEEGDRVILKNTPKTGADRADRCDDLVPDGNRGSGDGVRGSDDPFLTYRVEQVHPEAVELAPIDSERFADTLPTRGCFPTSIRYEIRPENEWIVVGEQSGFQSRRTSALGQCVPRFGADNPRTQGRVASGDIYVGPYFDFLQYDGPVSPIRRDEAPFEYTFGTQRFFSSRRFRTDAILPSDMLLTPRVEGGRKLLVSDASSDFVWIRNLTHLNDDPVRFQ